MDFHPDGDLSTPGLLLDVHEMAPNNNGAYARVPAMEAAGYTALPTTPCIGSAFVKDSSGTAKWFAGSATKVYQANGTGGWTDRSGGVTFAATTWDFCSFGANTVAANGASHLQSATTGSFGDITDSPTGASIVYVHRNAVIALGSSTDGAAWGRSNTADYTIWTPAANNDAAKGTLYGGVGGSITAGCPFANLAIAWKESAMYAGTYVGNSDPDQPVIRWDLVSDDPSHGCVAKNAWTITPVGLFFASRNDILVFTGNKPVSIADKVRKTFLLDAYTNNSRIWLAHDVANNHVYVWISPSGQSSNTQAWIYNYKTDQWGKLFSLNDSSLRLGAAKVPVRKANYKDYASLGGVTNPRQICQLFFDDLINEPVNLSSQSYTTAATLETGFKGRVDAESVLSRVYVVPDGVSSFTFSDPPTYTGFSYTVGKDKSNSKVTTIANGGWFDVSLQGYWFQGTVSVPSDAGTVSIQRLLHELQPVNRSKTYTLVE